MALIEKIEWKKKQFIKNNFPFIWNKKLYKNTLGKVADFSNPRDINEKIQWLMFYTDTSMWSVLADKFAVREYVKNRIGEDYLIPLLGHWTDEKAINFDTLPNKFVIKPNNGCYDSFICLDKEQINLELIREKLGQSLKKSFNENAEPHYRAIKPCIIAEYLLETDSPEGLVDYKIWCFNGEPYCIFVCVNRDPVTHHANFVYYDLNWNRYPEHISVDFQNEATCPRPENLQELLTIAQKLASGFPQVRVDLYDIKGKIYFGEMTFTSNFGMMPYFTQDVLNDMGKKCILPKRSNREIIITFFKRWLPIY